MRRTQKTLELSKAAVLCAALLLPAGAAAGDPSFNFAVTITNLTYDQIISPPVVVVHDGRFDLFEPGQPASQELASLAEDGMTAPLSGLLEVSAGVHDYDVVSGGIPPQGSATVEVHVSRFSRKLSLAGMLVSTNDAFVGLDGYVISFATRTVAAPAYDAGSEANTESCDHIPGPPCGKPGVRVTDGAEGFVHIHRGLHGTGDLDAAGKGWHNPVARVTIQRIGR